MVWPDGWQAVYTYDGLNRADKISGSLGGVVRDLRDYDFDLFGRRIRNSALSDGSSVTQGAAEIVTTYAYEADDDLSSIVHNYPGAAADLTLGYAYTPAGQTNSLTISDVLHRHAQGADGTQSYAAANPLNQYPSVTPIGGALTALSYNANGNLTGDGTRTYTFDALNRLLSVTGSPAASYGYDGLDRRTQKTVAGTVTRFLHAGADEIAEYTSTGVLLRRYVPGPGPDERAAMIDSGSSAPPLTSVSFAHTDRLGSALATTDSAGAPLQRFSYSLWGESNSAPTGYPFRYTGQRLDPETGLMFYKARTYSSALGRFLQTDPIGTADDMNMYAYVGNDPANLTDPSGMKAGDLGCQIYGRECQSESIGSYVYRGLANSKLSMWEELTESYSFFVRPLGVADAGIDLYQGDFFEERTQPISEFTTAFNARLRQLDIFCCFAAGTLVWTETGLRPIESIKIGEKVWARDEKSGETALKPVTAAVPKHNRALWTVIVTTPGSDKRSARTETFKTTDDHPWMLATGVWVQTKYLARGMAVACANGSPAKIVSIRDTGALTPVYNLEVADFHTYFVGENRLWVHNTCYKPLTPGNFRDNLALRTGIKPPDAQAHHVFVQKHRAMFHSRGINIDDPVYGSWTPPKTSPLSAEFDSIAGD